MLRFTMNRFAGFVLALCLTTVCLFLLSVQVPSSARTSVVNPTVTSEKDPPPSYGDPDVPIGPGAGKTGRSYVARGGVQPLVSPSEVRAPGEGTASDSVTLKRLHLFLLSLRSLYLRF